MRCSQADRLLAGEKDLWSKTWLAIAQQASLHVQARAGEHVLEPLWLQVSQGVWREVLAQAREVLR